MCLYTYFHLIFLDLKHKGSLLINQCAYLFNIFLFFLCFLRCWLIIKHKTILPMQIWEWKQKTNANSKWRRNFYLLPRHFGMGIYSCLISMLIFLRDALSILYHRIILNNFIKHLFFFYLILDEDLLLRSEQEIRKSARLQRQSNKDSSCQTLISLGDTWRITFKNLKNNLKF